MPTVLDAYSGCGGLSLGAHHAGFEIALAIDSDPLLSSSFHLNFPRSKVLRRDMRTFDEGAVKILLPDGVDGVIGGPPCQAFSEIGRRDDLDPRRDLVFEFFRLVQLARPKFFLFENVRGLMHRANFRLVQAGLELLPASWSILGPHVLDASEFGAPTKRRRLFLFGFNRENMAIPEKDFLLKGTPESVSVRQAIADLMSACEMSADERGFDRWKYDRRRTVSEYASKMRAAQGWFTGHRTTDHLESTLRRFRKLAEGQVDHIGKYVRLSWDGLCPTLRAGTGADRGSYQSVRPIHPSLDRVITPREAARLQGFPDAFLFHPTIWHSCRMIGNSVSPVLAKVLLSRIAQVLETGSTASRAAAA